MNENERLKLVRAALSLKQGDFAAALSISQGHLSDIENNRKEVSDRVVSICSLKYNVNEDWLRTGSGEMFNQLSEDEELAFYIGKITNGSDKFKIDFIKKICLFSEAEWDVLKKMFQK